MAAVPLLFRTAQIDQGHGRRAGERAAGHRQRAAERDRVTPTARGGGVLGRGAGALPRGAVSAVSRPPRPDAGRAGGTVGTCAGVACELRLDGRGGGRALLLTADRDLYQAVSERVAVLDLGKRHVLEVTVDDVIERYGIAPERVPDFIALRGDPSDGLPGAPGIGAKTAAELLRTYDTLEALLEQAQRQLADDGTGAGGT